MAAKAILPLWMLNHWSSLAIVSSALSALLAKAALAGTKNAKVNIATTRMHTPAAAQNFKLGVPHANQMEPATPMKAGTKTIGIVREIK